MRRRITSLFPGLLAALLVASGAVASVPCPRDCCDESPPERVAAAQDHCGAAAQDEPQRAPAPPGHEECGCHELSDDVGDRSAPVTVAPVATAVPVAALAERIDLAPPAPRATRDSRPARSPGHERAPPLFLLHASFLN